MCTFNNKNIKKKTEFLINAIEFFFSELLNVLRYVIFKTVFH